MNSRTVLDVPSLEDAFDLIAEGVDEAGPDNERLYLAKLALTLAHRLGDLEAVRDAVRTALTDLDRPNAGIG